MLCEECGCCVGAWVWCRYVDAVRGAWIWCGKCGARRYSVESVGCVSIGCRV